MTRNFIIAAVIAVIICLILGIWLSIWPTIILFLVLMVIGWFVSARLCDQAQPSADVPAGAETAAPSAPKQPEAKVAPAEPEIVAEPTAEPEAAPTADAPDTAGKPKLLDGARGGVADDLKKIKGVGPKLEKELNNAGVYHFDQIAAWSPQEVAWADQNLVSFKGRVSRDNWVDQAKELAKNE